MSKVKSGIDYTPRLTGESKKQGNGTNPSKNSVLNKYTSNLQNNTNQNANSGTYPGLQRNSTGSYNPYQYSYSRNSQNAINAQSAANDQIPSTVQGGVQYNQQSQQNNSKQQQFQNQLSSGQQNQQSTQNVQQNQYQNFQTLENQNTLEFDDPSLQNLQTGSSQTTMSNNSQVAKSELFTQNYRVSNTYRPISTQNINYGNQEKVNDNSHLKKNPNQLKVKLNKSSKSETPLKPEQKDQQINHQLQSNFTVGNQQNGMNLASNLSTKANQNNVNIPSAQQNMNNEMTQTPSGTSPQNYNQGTQQMQSIPEIQNNSNLMNQQMGGNNINSSTQYSKYQGQGRYDGAGLRYASGYSQHNQIGPQFGISYSQRVLSPKTEPNEFFNNYNQNFYQNTNANNKNRTRSPHKQTQKDATAANPVNSNPISQGSHPIGPKFGNMQINPNPHNSENIQMPNNSSSNNTVVPEYNQLKSPSYNQQSTLTIKQNTPNSNNLNDLGQGRKSQTPKKTFQQNSSNVFNYNLSNNNNKQNLEGQQDKKLISPVRKNLQSQQSGDQNQQNFFQFSYQQPSKSLSLNQHSQQLIEHKNDHVEQISSPTKHKKATSEMEINNPQKDQSEMFLIRDQDTGQVYDIRQIDKIDTFQKTNNQEYFDKLKKRHKNAWQGWWNSKKENNIKMIQSVRQNSFSIIEQLLQHERADLRADTDFKDQNQWAGIHYAANNGNRTILNLLISHDADINLTNNLEQTALMIGADKGFEEIVDICIRAGSDVNKQDLNQNTALHFACKSNNAQCVRVLLSCKSIDVNLKNVEGKLAIECTRNIEVVNIFAQLGKDNGLAQQMQNNMNSSQNSKMNNSANNNNNNVSNTNNPNLNNENNEQFNSQKGKKRYTANHLSEDSTYSISQNAIGQNSNFSTTPNQSKNQNQPAKSLPNYEQILSQSALSGFYGQKLTLSTNHGQSNQYTNQLKSPQHPPNLNYQNSQQSNMQQDNQKRSFEVTKQYSNSGVMSSGSNNNNNRSSNSNSKSGGTMHGLEGSPNQPHTQSISSQESSQSSQNQLTDSQIQHNGSNLYGQQNNSSQPWKVIIHDFPDGSIMKMFNNSPRKEKQNNNSSGNFNNQIGSNNNNFNTQASTNETLGNTYSTSNQYINVEQTLSPSQKHHKIHSQDAIMSSQNIRQNQPQNQQQQNQLSPSNYEPQMAQKVGPQDFRIVNQIGRGSFGEVYLVEKKGTDQYFAMKMLHKSKVLGQNLTKYAMTERNVLSIMSHPFIVKLMFAFQTSKDLFLIMEYMPGGDLSHALQRDKKFSESRARIYLSEILLAIKHLHKHDIIYRDLKPENIVIDNEGHAMLTDFGLSKDGVFDHYSTHSFCGSLAYLAPEMLKRCGHGKAVDYYHLGVLLFEMLTGSPPFFSESKDEICHNIEFQDIRFPSHVSDNARNLISRLLVKNPQKRLGFGKNDFEEIKKHPFFNGVNWTQVYQRKQKPPAPFIKPVVESRSSAPPNFMMTMTPNGMMTDNHINGWSFINNMDSQNNNINSNNNINNFNNIQINHNQNNISNNNRNTNKF